MKLHRVILLEFQSTLPRGERRVPGSTRLPFGNFNPRSREGSDIEFQFGKETHTVGISIHAPARGATSEVPDREPEKPKFQSTLPRGERHKSDLQIDFKTVFQSTLPRGERRYCRPRRYLLRSISIHAPARGATYLDDATKEQIEISIHAPARGATHSPADHFHGIIISIHAPARGATDFGFNLCRDTVISIHAPARGATWPFWR